ncbi:hypothetical protein CTAYLR_007037 [Chrysophaeum taylorii]|uniref:Uncharacterized protein n=1 Tax=Chrysophaeum taylorii TaxID=2483200 RepID=A0AAD7U6V6_9STRA|nr:hypothetical protein CTAYLR_007037 [Chrysophaeum taylorii]
MAGQHQRDLSSAIPRSDVEHRINVRLGLAEILVAGRFTATIGTTPSTATRSVTTAASISAGAGRQREPRNNGCAWLVARDAQIVVSAIYRSEKISGERNPSALSVSGGAPTIPHGLETISRLVYAPPVAPLIVKVKLHFKEFVATAKYGIAAADLSFADAKVEEGSEAATPQGPRDRRASSIESLKGAIHITMEVQPRVLRSSCRRTSKVINELNERVRSLCSADEELVGADESLVETLRESVDDVNRIFRACEKPVHANVYAQTYKRELRQIEERIEFELALLESLQILLTADSDDAKIREARKVADMIDRLELARMVSGACVHALMKMLTDQTAAELVKEAAVAALVSISTWTKIRANLEIIGNYKNGLEALVNEVKDGTTRAQADAALVLRDLASASASFRAAVVQVGALKPLCALLDITPFDEEAEENEEFSYRDAACGAAARCLWNLSFENDQNREKIREAGCVRKLGAILGRINGRIISWSTYEAIAGALANLVLDEDNKRELEHDLDFDGLVLILDENTTPLPIKESTVRLLCNLMINSPQRRHTFATDTNLVPVLVGILTDRHLRPTGARLLTAAAAAVQQLALETPGKVAVARHGGIKTLMALVRSHGAESLKASAVLALATLARENINNEMLIIEAGLTSLCAFLRRAKTAAGQEVAVICLCRLSADAYARELIIRANAFPPLVNIVSHGTEAGRHAAAALILNLALDEEHQGTIVKAGAIAPLCALVDTGKYDARCAAAGALKNLTNLAVVRKTIASAWDMASVSPSFAQTHRFTEFQVDTFIDNRIKNNNKQRPKPTRSLSKWSESPEREIAFENELPAAIKSPTRAVSPSQMVPKMRKSGTVDALKRGISVMLPRRRRTLTSDSETSPANISADSSESSRGFPRNEAS